MKRKQLLALVLVIAMMIGMMPGAKALSFGGECPSPYNHGSHFSPTNVPICFWCGYNGCTHTNNKWDDKKDSSVLPVYQIENEQNHRVISSYKRYCKDCGAYMKNVTDDGKLEAHNFTNGDTCVCGYKKPVCTHAGRNWEDVYNSSKDSFSDITSECHTIYYYRDRYCKDCGAYVTTVNKITATQKHDFTNGDTCICGYKKPVCTHINGNWNDVYDSSVLPVYKFENEQNHRVFNSYKRYCKDCNEYVKNVTDDGTFRTHNFTNGDTCICGYKKPVSGGEGQHVGVSAKIDTEYRQYGNATAHQKRDVYGYICSICSETIIERYSEWIEENHKDSGEGWCLYCGAAVGAAQSKDEPTVGSCTHPNYGYDLNGKGRTVMLDDEKHLYIFPVIYYCTICGERWNGTESTEGKHTLIPKTEHEILNSTFHLVKEYSVCSAGCGIKELVNVTTADHNASEKKSVKVTQFSQSNDRHVTEHVVTEVTSLTCADCEYEISTKSNEDWQNHSYTNDKCACGYSMVEEYYDVLRNLPSGSNPMENPVISEIVWAKLTGSGMNRDEAEEIHDMIENVREKYATYRDIYLYSMFLFDTDRNWIPTEEIKSSHFNHEDNKLNIRKNAPSSELPTTWFHEIGHAIDYNAGIDDYVTMNDEVFYRMRDDVKKLVVAQATSDQHPILASKWSKLTQQEQDMIIHSIIGSNNGYPEQYDNISKKWSISSVNLSEDLQSLRDEIVGNMKAVAYGGTNDTRSAYMVTDCIEGMTNGRVSLPRGFDNMDFFDLLYVNNNYYSFAHMSSVPDYWYSDDGNPTFYQCLEAWAEYLSAVMTNNTDAINSNLYYFPSTCEYFEQTLAPQVLENIKKLALE